MIEARLLPEASLEITVTPEMRAAFEGEVVHDVYGTAAMVQHMELAARRVLLPAREAHEEGIGYRVEVTHLAPAPVGIVPVLHGIGLGLLPALLSHQFQDLDRRVVVVQHLPLSRLPSAVKSWPHRWQRSFCNW